MDGGRVIASTREPIPTVVTINGKKVTTDSQEFEVKLVESTGAHNEFWYWHAKTGTIRSADNGGRCLSWDHTAPNLKAGVRAVVRPCSFKPEEITEKEGAKYTKDNYHVVSDAKADMCLSTKKDKNTEGQLIQWRTCSPTKQHQNWYPMYRYQATGPHWNRL